MLIYSYSAIFRHVVSFCSPSLVLKKMLKIFRMKTESKNILMFFFAIYINISIFAL